MRAPNGLSDAGKRAFHQAKEVAELQTAPAERFAEAAVRFARAVDLAGRIRAEWVKRGRPLLDVGGATGKIVVPHPLLRMISDAEGEAARYGAAFGLDPRSAKKLGAVMGRPQERVPARTQGEPAKVVPLRRRRNP